LRRLRWLDRLGHARGLPRRRASSDFVTSDAFEPVWVCAAAFSAACSLRQRSIFEARGSCWTTTGTVLVWVATAVAPVERVEQEIGEGDQRRSEVPQRRSTDMLGIAWLQPQTELGMADKRARPRAVPYMYWSDDSMFSVQAPSRS